MKMAALAGPNLQENRVGAGIWDCESIPRATGIPRGNELDAFFSCPWTEFCFCDATRRRSNYEVFPEIISATRGRASNSFHSASQSFTIHAFSIIELLLLIE